jgi:oxaloacetate decarboxylase beta subunit
MDMTFAETAAKFFASIGLTNLTIPHVIMVLLSFFLMYLAIAKRFEPLLLLPLAFGMFIANMPMSNLSAYDEPQGLLFFLYMGIKYVVYPPMIFACIGSMTDFGPLIGNPKSAFIGLGGQLGLFTALFAAVGLGNVFSKFVPGFEGFTWAEAASIGIIGSADGPTSIFTATTLAPHMLSAVAIAAFSYMALVPMIQPPIMRLLTNDWERRIVMPPPKQVTRRQKLFFPIIATVLTLLFVPTAGALIGMLMLGNLIRESGVAERYVRMLNNELLNILTFLIALSIGASAHAKYFLTFETLLIIVLGLFAFVSGTFGGVLIAKLLCHLTGGKVNPLIGNSGVSAMPMAARISQKLGQQYNPQNYLLMHAMGPIVASTMGSALVAGIFIALFGA